MTRYRPVVVLFVLVAALAIRLQPVVGESFHYDAIVHQQAAADGLAANAWDHEDTWRLRRFHPPLVSYIVMGNNALFGDGLTGARVFAMVFGAAACALVAAAVLAFGWRRRRGGAGGDDAFLPGAISGAAAAGLMLAYLPVHLYIGRTANWDAVYSAFATGTLLALALHLVSPCRRRVWSAGILWALSFLTSELALALLPAVAATWWADRRREGYTAKPWLVAAAGAVVLIAILWPAGVLRLDILKTLRFRWYDSVHGGRNAPWTAFYSTLWKQAPAYAVAASVSVIVLVRAWRTRHRGGGTAPRLLPLLPFAAYAATVFALSTRQRLVYIHHIADLFPALTVLMGAAFVVGFSRIRSGGGRAVVAALSVGAVALTVYAGTRDDPEVVGPQEHPGLATLGEFLQAHPDARTLFHYTAQMEYYAPGARVEGTRQRHWTADDVVRAKIEGYDFVATDRSMLAGDFIYTPEALENALKPHYALERVIEHRRSGEPVVWIYSLRRE